MTTPPTPSAQKCEVEKNIEFATSLADFFEKFRENDVPQIRYYLANKMLCAEDLMNLSDIVYSEIGQIQDKQDERLLALNGDKSDKRVGNYDFVVGRSFINNINNFTPKDIQKDSESTAHIIKTLTTIAYKNQLKNTLFILDVMIFDEEIWGPSPTIH